VTFYGANGHDVVNKIELRGCRGEMLDLHETVATAYNNSLQRDRVR
jgi:hypothetical protein